MEEKINLNQLGDEQPDPSLADLEMEVRLLEWTISKKMKVAKLLQNLSYDNATRKLSIVYGNDVTLPDFSIPKGYINGYQLTEVSNNLKIGEGICTDSTDTATIVNIELTKLYANWGEGSNAGILDDGSFEDYQNYYLFAILKSDNTTADFLCSLSSTSPVLPTNYVYFRLIGSFNDNLLNLVNYQTLYQYNETGTDLPINYLFFYSLLNFGTFLTTRLYARDTNNLKNIKIESMQKYFTYPFVAGNGEGGFVDAIVNNTDYYIYALYNETIGTKDICFKTSPNSTLPTGYTNYRLVGYLYISNTGVINIVKKDDLNDNINIDTATTLRFYYKNVTYNGTSNATFNLPSILSSVGTRINLFNSTVYEVILDPSSSQLIQGKSTAIISAGDNVTIYNNGIEWKLL